MNDVCVVQVADADEHLIHEEGQTAVVEADAAGDLAMGKQEGQTS